MKYPYRKSIRKKGYDYSAPGFYFITLYADGGQHCFGEVSDGKMILDKGGKIAEQCWIDIPDHFPNVRLHDYIIMPNHMHGIIEIIGNSPNEKLKNEFQKIIPGSIGSIVKGYKIGVTKWFRANTNIEKVWHRNYYDIIIRNERAYKNIVRYIQENPLKW